MTREPNWMYGRYVVDGESVVIASPLLHPLTWRVVKCMPSERVSSPTRVQPTKGWELLSDEVFEHYRNRVASMKEPKRD